MDDARDHGESDDGQGSLAARSHPDQEDTHWSGLMAVEIRTNMEILVVDRRHEPSSAKTSK